MSRRGGDAHRDEVDGRRLLVTLLAPAISAGQLERAFRAIASSGATCERIVHLASYPVDCYELIVHRTRPRGAARGVDAPRPMRAGSTSRSSARGCTGAPSTS